MKTYANIIDLLNFEGPGLQDYVTPNELNQLLDGTLPHGTIADRYIDDLIHTTLVAVETDDTETRADLLVWIRDELDIAIEQRKDMAREEAQQIKLDALQKVVATEERLDGLIHYRKGELALEARALGVPKAAIADALRISRPTLDKWLQEQQDRALFNEAIYTLVRRDMSKTDQAMLFDALGIRDTSGQASAFLAGLTTRTLDDLRDGERELLDCAEKRARELA
ncbi:hypothetical protein PV405_08675 [Streptomyces sp. ME02-6979-3A]|uniref:hypothetical protein n=1 Tax=Streptomyces sp. ME02-6979-3A TaxID=3028673 RepID=UPI0029ABCD4E|nr:hypothetical protein [Streptomyces sp. ME02-6979-3A]MDX3324740.1 hypothetical protein [Streptomyces sp. ME02-6979-3A]